MIDETRIELFALRGQCELSHSGTLYQLLGMAVVAPCCGTSALNKADGTMKEEDYLTSSQLQVGWNLDLFGSSSKTGISDRTGLRWDGLRKTLTLTLKNPGLCQESNQFN